jgi:hypothetical protein
MTVLNQVKVNGVQYRLQGRRCGKKGCKCNIPGQEHGPYWYAYSDHGPAKYVGGDLPEHVKKHIELLKASKPKIKKLRDQIEKKRKEHQEAVWKADRELQALRALEAGEYAASEVLKSLDLGEFNGHGGG